MYHFLFYFQADKLVNAIMEAQGSQEKGMSVKEEVDEVGSLPLHGESHSV
jgi:hypothetical protein